VVVKAGPAPRTEAAMLRALAAAGVPTPEVLFADAAMLVLSWVDGGDGVCGAWGDLGTVLARLHACTGPHYGWHEDYAFSSLPIANARRDRWPDFWADRRLRPMLPHLPATLAQRIERLADDLRNRLPLHPPAALLHGDLWGGNVIARGTRVAALIDPACYYGHAEVDLAMLQLFDAPGTAFHQSYGALPADAMQRLAIYRLWPALVHLRLFGDGYRGLVEAQLRLAGA